ncbi:MAG: hypothetical protein IJE40_01545 [Clostridia bacterium]|nr:hypothetical protein [Clostridia bacterium]
MKKLFVFLLAVLSVSIIFSSCSSSDVEIPEFFKESIMDEPRYFPKPDEPDFLYTIDRGPLTNYEKIMLASMQGVTAKDKPCIYILENDSYRLWLDRIVADKGIVTENENDVYALLSKVAESINGYILYDLADNTSLNVATSLAGINRAILVDYHIEETIKSMGFECIMDVRGLDDRWLYNNYKDKFGQGEDLLNDEFILEQRALEYDDRNFLLRDYAIFCNMACIYQSDSPLKDAFLKKLKNDSAIIGWGDGDKVGESELGTIAAINGVMQIASDWHANLSVLSSIRPKEEIIKQHTATDPEKLETENVHYVTFIWSDGDNIQWTSGSFPNNPTFWASESRGRYNIGWGINQLLYEAAPTTVEYFYETAANNENGKDYFVVGPHYAYATKYEKTLNDWTYNLNVLMGKTDLKYVMINELDTMNVFPEAFDEYTEHENIHGLFYLEYEKYHRENGKIVWSNGKPVVSAKYAIWDPNGMDDATPEDCLEKLNSAPVDITSEDGYSFVIIHAWSGYTMDDICDMISKLDDHVKVVTPDEFMQQIMRNVKHD